MTEQQALATGQPCIYEQCGSGDATAVYEDHLYCFSCEKRTNTTTPEDYIIKGDVRRHKMTEKKAVVTSVGVKMRGKSRDLKDRKLKKHTLDKYMVGVGCKDGKVKAHFYPYFHKDSHVANKIRYVENKSFSWDGSEWSNKVGLFGQQLFPSGSSDYITICEGELDAMSVYQMTGSKFPAVSVRSATSAVKDIKRQLEYLMTFRKGVVLCLDADEAGQKHIEDIAALFEVGKCKIMHLDPKLKDPNGYLVGGKSQEFVNLWWKAEKFKPKDIVASSELGERIKARKKKSSLAVPFDGLQEKTFGFRKGETWLIAARRGVGKTQLMRELEYGIIQADPEAKIGALFLEEPVEDSGLGLMGIHLNMPMHLPTCEYTDADFDRGEKEILSTNKVFYYDQFGDCSIDNIINKIRYFAKAEDCEYIFLDHLGMLSSSQTNDPRLVLDEAAKRLKTLAIELDVCIIQAIHLNREGMVRGSDAPENYANIVMHLERDGVNDDEVIKTTTVATITKNRFWGGGTGKAAYLKGDLITGRLEEVEEPIEFQDI